MDLLVNLSYLKAKSMAYTYNNYKIRKIVAIQKRKEIIVSTCKQVADKLKRWRQFTRTTLDQEKEEELKKKSAQQVKFEEKDETHEAQHDNEQQQEDLDAHVDDQVIKRVEKLSFDDS